MNGSIKWIIGIILMSFIFIAGFNAQAVLRLGTRVQAHSNLVGHPGMVERVAAVKEQLDKIERNQEEILIELRQR